MTYSANFITFLKVNLVARMVIGVLFTSFFRPFLSQSNFTIISTGVRIAVLLNISLLMWGIAVASTRQEKIGWGLLLIHFFAALIITPSVGNDLAGLYRTLATIAIINYVTTLIAVYLITGTRKRYQLLLVFVFLVFSNPFVLLAITPFQQLIIFSNLLNFFNDLNLILLTVFLAFLFWHSDELLTKGQITAYAENYPSPYR